jgi:uncharacterized membrane protein
MKTITEKEFYEDLERERRKSLIVVNFGIVAVVVAVVAVVLLLLANEKEPKETKYVEQIMIA